MNAEQMNAYMDVLSDWATSSGLHALAYLGKIILALIVFLIVYRVVHYICRVIAQKLEKTNLEPTVFRFVISVVRYSILVITVVMIVVKLDIVAASSIAAVVASVGVALSLALQGGLSNLAGGFMIMLLHPFRKGDYIIIPSLDVEGSVSEIDIYYTRIHTFDNQMVLIPNGKVTDNTITNVTAMGHRKLEIKVSISYESDIRAAKTALEALVREQPYLSEEELQIFVDELGDSAVVLGLRAWVSCENYFPARWDMIEKIKERFDEMGIAIPYKQLDVHLVPEKN